MLQLHLSQFLLASTGVVVAFMGLPSSVLDADQQAIVDPIVEQRSKDSPKTNIQAKDKNTRPFENKEPIPVHNALLKMPFHISTPGRDSRALSEQFRENLFLSLIERKVDSPEITTSNAVVTHKEELAQEKAAHKKTVIVGTANRIVVPSIGVDLLVQIGSYDTSSGSWQVDDSSAFHAATTVPVNDSNGTTLIYGHAKWGVFGALPDIQLGAEASVFTAEGKRFVYTVESVGQVDPSDVSMLTVEGSPKLVLQTCSGFFDQHRTLVVFNLKEIV